jgi:hypothetical protein
MKEYVKLQIIKHALKYYLSRDASEEDKAKERTVLKNIIEEIDLLKARYRI